MEAAITQPKWIHRAAGMDPLLTGAYECPDLRISIPQIKSPGEHSFEVLGCEQPAGVTLVSRGGLVISPAARSPEVVPPSFSGRCRA